MDPRVAGASDGGQKQPSRRGVWRRLWEIILPERVPLTGSLVFLAMHSFVTLSIPKRLGVLIDLSESRDQHRIRSFCVGIAGLFCFGGCANLCRIYLSGMASERIIANLRKKVFQKLVSQPMPFYDDSRNRTTELVHRLSHDCEKIGRTLTENMINGVKNIGQTVGALTIMFRTSPTIAGMLFLVLPPVALSAACYGRFAKRLAAQAADEMAEKSVMAEEYLGNIRIVIAFAEETQAWEKYARHVDASLASARRGVIASASYTSFLQTTGYFVVLALLYAGSVQVSKGKLTVGKLTSLLMYTVFGGVGIMGVGNFAADMGRCAGMASRVFALLDLDSADDARVYATSSPQRGDVSPSIGDAVVNRADPTICETHMLPKDSVGGEVSVQNVSFHYPSRPAVQVWKDVSFCIPSGSCCAVVGHSGAGKSTLTNLLLKLYHQDVGTVMVDGVDVQSMSNKQLRDLIVYVPQDPLLFGGTIRANILFGVDAQGADSALAVAAARKANAHDFILSLKDGYDTFVGEKGSQLSGGQRQRIAIARALAKEMQGDSRILLFDEATAGLDPVNKQALQETMKEIMTQDRQGDEQTHRRTIICITHDEELLRCCDYVVAMQGGEVASHGPFDHGKMSLAEMSQYTMKVPSMDDGAEEVNVTCE
eukprot:TRINITY_DN19709_c0_g1_i1.p1 TRINITY_DN19709_c0_g1~~TRINITY_DN19709_c0_g1_i1.p1  ORF type:complete len:668 (+),score=247.10 TRINITY_DN19709_c0_g1_i1:46-2004(+)